jgi:signal transduction histidine kinase
MERLDRSGALATRVATVAAIGSASAGALVLLGWAFDVEPLRRLMLGTIHMLPNTAVGFMLGGASLWLQRRPRAASSPLEYLARAMAGLVLALGALTLGERLFEWVVGIDRILFPEMLARHPYRPLGRMATNSALAFTLAGAALLWLDVVTRPRRRPAVWFATIGVAIASIAIVGHLYDAQGLYRFDVAAAMAVSTALAFFLLHVGILFARPSAAGVALLLAEDTAGVLSRRLLLAVVLVPLVLGRGFIVARERAVVSRAAGIAIFVVAVIAILLAVVLRVSRVVQVGDRARQRMLEREAAARAEAERATRAKNDFLAVMSHELRTPLNAIIGYGSLLRDGIPDPITDGQSRQLQRIASSARHLLALIDQVLTLSRVELGEEQVLPAPVSAQALLEEAASMVETQARAKGLAFEVSLPREPIELVTDADKLRQALVNLLGNAVKFTERGTVQMRLTVDGYDTVVFEVEDTGIGIAPEHHERVFESFWQVDQAPARRAGGVGLGLHVTRHLVRLLGGDVTVRSHLGDGSCFAMRVPRRWWASTTPTEQQVAASVGQGTSP